MCPVDACGGDAACRPGGSAACRLPHLSRALASKQQEREHEAERQPRRAARATACSGRGAARHGGGGGALRHCVPLQRAAGVLVLLCCLVARVSSTARGVCRVAGDGAQLAAALLCSTNGDPGAPEQARGWSPGLGDAALADCDGEDAVRSFTRPPQQFYTTQRAVGCGHMWCGCRWRLRPAAAAARYAVSAGRAGITPAALRRCCMQHLTPCSQTPPVCG